MCAPAGEFCQSASQSGSSHSTRTIDWFCSLKDRARSWSEWRAGVCGRSQMCHFYVALQRGGIGDRRKSVAARKISVMSLIRYHSSLTYPSAIPELSGTVLPQTIGLRRPLIADRHLGDHLRSLSHQSGSFLAQRLPCSVAGGWQVLLCVREKSRLLSRPISSAPTMAYLGEASSLQGGRRPHNHSTLEYYRRQLSAAFVGLQLLYSLNGR